MTPALGGAVELLERALGYARVVLADVDAEALQRPTPCAGWDLAQLLGHMEDALDAFLEAADGMVAVDRRPPAAGGVDALRHKACALLAAWASAAEQTEAADPGHNPGHDPVSVGDAGLAGPVLVLAAALEITVHGWDVGQATGRGPRIPERLAQDLYAASQVLVGADDRGPRFAPPRRVPAGAAADVRLLAFLGRDLTGPPHPIGRKTDPPTGLAS